MKPTLLLIPAILLSSCEINYNCGGSHVSSSIANSSISGLFLYKLKSYDSISANRNNHLLDITQCWVERASTIDCADNKIKVLGNKTVVIKLKSPIKRSQFVQLEDDYALTFNRKILQFTLKDRIPDTVFLKVFEERADSNKLIGIMTFVK